MISIRSFINNFDEIILNLEKRHTNSQFIQEVKNHLKIAQQLQAYQSNQQELQTNRNLLIKEGIQTKQEVLLINQKLDEIEKEINTRQLNLNKVLPLIPNFLDEEVKIGMDETENLEIYRYGENIKNSKLHYDMNLVHTAVHMCNGRFIYLKGKIATLERALGNFLINFLVSRGFTEVSIPHLLSEEALYRTGHMPKDKDNMFHISHKNMYLIPTSECVLLNLLANTTISIKDIPLRYTAFNVNFRKEAGAAGRDTKGLIRLNQFPKVEMVAFTTPEGANNMFKEFLSNGEEALKLLGLSYRVLSLCSGDLGFNAKKTYDLEVWMAGAQEYREVSSISDCGNFQSTRLNCKYRNMDDSKELLHTLNGTCLGVGRVLAAIMEQYYDSTQNIIHIPKLLIPYTTFDKIIL